MVDEGHLKSGTGRARAVWDSVSGRIDSGHCFSKSLDRSLRTTRDTQGGVEGERL